MIALCIQDSRIMRSPYPRGCCDIPCCSLCVTFVCECSDGSSPPCVHYRQIRHFEGRFSVEGFGLQSTLPDSFCLLINCKFLFCARLGQNVICVLDILCFSTFSVTYCVAKHFFDHSSRLSRFCFRPDFLPHATAICLGGWPKYK